MRNSQDFHSLIPLQFRFPNLHFPLEESCFIPLLARGDFASRGSVFFFFPEHSPSFQEDPAFPRCPRHPGGCRGAGMARRNPKPTNHPAGNGAGRIPCSHRTYPIPLSSIRIWCRVFLWIGMKGLCWRLEFTLQDLPLTLRNCPNSKKLRPNLGLPYEAEAT